MDLVILEIIALSFLGLLKLIVDYFRKQYYLNKAFIMITNRLESGNIDVRDSVAGSFMELPVRVTLLSFMNRYVDYLTENKKSEFVAKVSEYRNKVLNIHSIGKVPEGILPMLVDVEEASKRGEQETVSERLIELARVLARKEKQYNLSRKWNYINVIIAILSIVATFYFGLQ